MTEVREAASVERERKETRPALLALGSVLGATAASSCCIVPLAFVQFGRNRRLDRQPHHSRTLSARFRRHHARFPRGGILDGLSETEGRVRRRLRLCPTGTAPHGQDRSLERNPIGRRRYGFSLRSTGAVRYLKQ